MDQVWDPRGEADVALARVVEGFGQQVLGRADMFEGLLHDDIPQLPREIALLTAAARSGVADLLAERVRQGISPQAAVTMAAAEMTARTAVDASGALWAAAVFARVLGYPQPPVAQVAPAQAPTAPVPAGHVPRAQAQPAQAQHAQAQPAQAQPAQAQPAQAQHAQAQHAQAPPGGAIPAQVPPGAPQVPAAAVPTALIGPGARDAWGRPVPGTGPAQEAVRPFGDQALTVLPTANGGRGLATAAAVSAGIAAPLELLWGLAAHAHGTFFWLAAIVLLAGLGGVAVWAARGARGGAGFAAMLGLAVPFASWGIYAAAAAPSFFGLSASRRDVLELLSAAWLAATLAAIGIAIAGLARWRQLGRRRGPVVFLAVVTAAAAVGFALANILAQETSQGQPVGNVLGPNVTGWYIVWGIAFLALVSVPPVLAAFLLPSSGVRLAVWSGWLIFGLAWQVSATPTTGYKAAPGLYLTWILWIAVLAGTAIMAARRPADAATGSAAYG